MTPPLYSNVFSENRKEEIHGRFRAIILWNDVMRLVLKVTESERINAHAGLLRIVAFLAAFPMVISRGGFGLSAQHAPE